MQFPLKTRVYHTCMRSKTFLSLSLPVTGSQHLKRRPNPSKNFTYFHKASHTSYPNSILVGSNNTHHLFSSVAPNLGHENGRISRGPLEMSGDILVVTNRMLLNTLQRPQKKTFLAQMSVVLRWTSGIGYILFSGTV